MTGVECFIISPKYSPASARGRELPACLAHDLAMRQQPQLVSDVPRGETPMKQPQPIRTRSEAPVTSYPGGFGRDPSVATERGQPSTDTTPTILLKSGAYTLSS